MAVLDENEIESRASELNVAWTVVDGVGLERVFEFPDFSSALSFVNQLGAIANELNHHPEIALSWGRVEVSLSTHSEAGLTNKDFEFAKRIDQNSN